MTDLEREQNRVPENPQNERPESAPQSTASEDNAQQYTASGSAGEETGTSQAGAQKAGSARAGSTDPNSRGKVSPDPADKTEYEENNGERTKGLFGETDRARGEYHFRNGTTQQVYSNARYIPVGESTDPPHYYRPAAKKPVQEQSVKKARKNPAGKQNTAGGMAILMFLCFACAVLGGLAGALLTVRLTTSSAGHVDRTETSDQAAYDAQMLSEAAATEAPQPEEVPLSAGEIYSLAQAQVVNVTVETVKVDYFGYQTPSSVSGTGFIISEDGYILTNYHVVEDAVESGLNVTVSLSDGSVFIGKVTGTEEDSDLAVIKIEQDGLTPVTFGDSDELAVGDEIYTVGNPYGVLEYSMTMGHVSALNRQIATDDDETSRNMFQLDADVFSGNSGGPVYDSFGKVVGIVTAKYSSSGMDGIGFAIPVNDAVPVVYELLDKGYVSGKASLGVSFDERYSSVYSRYYRLPEGAYIYSVTPGSCAEKAGLQAGDIVMKIGEKSVESADDVTSLLKDYQAGDTATVTIYRSGGVYTTSVTFDEAIPSHILENSEESSENITAA